MRILHGLFEHAAAAAEGRVPIFVGAIQDGSIFLNVVKLKKLLGEAVQEKFAELKQMQADRCPKELGARITDLIENGDLERAAGLPIAGEQIAATNPTTAPSSQLARGARKPAMKSKESTGRKKPISRPDSAKTIAARSSRPPLVSQLWMSNKATTRV